MYVMSDMQTPFVNLSSHEYLGSGYETHLNNTIKKIHVLLFTTRFLSAQATKEQCIRIHLIRTI